MKNIPGVKNFTQSGEKNIFQGKRNVTEFLPFILQTTTNKKFFESTLDQLLSSGSTQSFDTYWGKISGSSYNYETDLFNPENTSLRQNYQFGQGFFVDNETFGKKSISYINIINRLTELGYNTGNLDSLFTEEGYTLDLPIDIDMFVNYTNYYWLPMDIPVCDIDATDQNPIDFDNIEKLNTYTTPILNNGKQLTFYNGMRVKFIGDNITGSSINFELNATYIVEGVGSGNINLIKQYDSTGKNLFPKVVPYTPKIPSEWDANDWQEFDYDVSNFVNIEKEYVVIDRGSVDKNQWSRINQWFSYYAITETAAYLDIPFSLIRNTGFRGTRPIIQFKKNIELFDSGNILKYFINHHFDGNINPTTEIIGKETYNNNGFQLEDGDLVLFTNNENTAYNNKIYTVSNVGDSILLTLEYDTVDFVDFEKSFLLHSNVKGLINNEFYWLENNWIKGQQKTSRGSSPKFNLYDYTATKLDQYSESTFFGNNIFSFYQSDVYPIDSETNMRLKTDNNSASDYVFNVDIETIRYFRNNITDNIIEIKGDYFYKNIESQRLVSIWSPIEEKQRVYANKTVITQDLTENLVIEMGGYPEKTTTYFAGNETDNTYFYGMNSSGLTNTGNKDQSLFFMKDTDYTLITLSTAENIEILDPLGNIPADIIVTGDEVKNIKITNAYSYDKLIFKFGSKVYNVFVSEKNSGYKVYKNGSILAENVDYTVVDKKITISETSAIGDVYEIVYVSNDTTDARDYASVVKYNPKNEKITSLNYSNMYNHFSDILLNSPYFNGTVNGFNNYHITPKIHNYGGKIRQQINNPINHLVLSSYNETDPLSAITKVAIDYANFKNYFKSKISQLWNSYEFENIHTLVDKALEEMNVGKNMDFIYATSDMIYYDEANTYEYSYSESTANYDIGTPVHNYGDKNIHVYVWAYELYGSQPQWKILTKNRDYIIQSDKVVITRNLNTDNTFEPKLKIKVYDKQTFTSFVPFSPCKLGFIQPTEVTISEEYLNCHDGSRYLLNGDIFDVNSANFDVVGAAIYDFETRIYNNLIDDNFKVVDIRSYIPRKNIDSPYDMETINYLLELEFNNWTVDFEYSSESIEEVYDGNNKFTWNYSTVSDFASWKSIYKNTFGTDRPHTHPWEMLGYYYKPEWWNTWYSWTDQTARDRLINSLKNGIISEPNGINEQINPKFSHYDYDWDNNILVDISGNLNDPVAAGVVSEPAFVDAAIRFNFGAGINSQEKGWIDSSDYIFSLIKVLMKLRPFEIFQNYWKLTNIINIDSEIFEFAYKVYEDEYTRRIDDISKLHYYTSVGEIENIRITNGGSNYSQANVISEFNKEGTAKFEPFIRDGKIESIKILNPGFDYKEDINLIIISGDGTGAIANGIVATQRLKTVLGLNAVIVENVASVEKSNIVTELLNSVTVSPIVHLGGYSDKQKLDIILDGSYKNGQIYLPKEDYFVFLSKNPELSEQFYSGIRFEKIADKIAVYGYNQTEKHFKYNRPNKNSQNFIQTIGKYQLLKYKNYNEKIENMKYGSVFSKKQDLYDFILGLNNYYEMVGFTNMDWENQATEVITWALSDSTDDFYVNGLIDNELTYSYGNHGYIDSFEKENRILNKDFNYINEKNINVIRNEDNLLIKTRNEEIYGINIRISEFEHVIVINQKTKFGDIVADPITGLYQSRLRIRGERTRNWNGKLEANGYVVSNETIFNNFDSNVREIENDVNNTNSKFLNSLTKKTNRFNVGYQEPTYLIGTFVDENNSYSYNIGERKYRGTKFSIDSYLRNNNLFGINIDKHELSEEWMLRIGNYGDTRKSDPVQVELDQSLVKSNPQAIRFNEIQQLDRLDDQVIDISKNDKNYISGNLSKFIEMMPIQKSGRLTINESRTFERFYRNSGLPLTTEVEYKIKSVDDIESVFDNTQYYANIPDWSSVTSYNKGDIVRKDGKVYKLKIENTGLNFGGEPILVNGTVTFPSVPSGTTLIIGSNDASSSEITYRTVTFEKTAVVSSFNPIILQGSISNPSVSAGDTLIIDNNVITFTNPTPETLVFNPLLTLNQIAAQINNANIFGIRARAKPLFLSQIVTGNVLEITSTNQSITIGQSTSISKLGLTAGIVRATSTTVVSPAELSLFEVVEQINNAQIPNITAISLNNKLQIQTSNQELIIGEGTANQYLGFTSLIRPAREFIENEFDDADWEVINDPVDISIWTVDNVGQQVISSNRTRGYGVYRTFDFNYNILEICEGVESGDDALVTVSSPHNLAVNDYVIIVNSTSVPNVDGIHRVTGVFTPTSFLIDKYIEEKGFSGKVLKLNQVRFNTSVELYNTVDNPSYSNQGFGWKPGMIAYVDSIIENGQSTGIGGVYMCTENYSLDEQNTVSFELIRKQVSKVNNYTIENAKTFNGETQKNIAQLEVYDPYKGIIPGIVDKEIDLKNLYDMAVYNNTTDPTMFDIDEKNYWSDEHVGKRWWDLSNAIYLDYEQDTIEYRQGNWGKLFPTSTIDVYEWTKSPVPPDEYVNATNTKTVIDGVELTGEPYYITDKFGDILYYWTEETKFNADSGTEETFYYYWVKNKSTVPNKDRIYSVLQLRNIIENPSENGIYWIAACNENTVLISNLSNCINCDDTVLQINFENSDIENHKEYILLDKKSIIPEFFHILMRDSLSGYDKHEKKLEYDIWDDTTIYDRGDVVSYENNFYIATKINQNSEPFIPTSNVLLPPLTWNPLIDVVSIDETENWNIETFGYTWDSAPWDKKLWDREFVDGLENIGSYLTINAPNRVPNPKLHRYNRQGISIRPRQTLIKNIKDARREFINKVNKELKKINVVDNVKSWESLFNKIISTGYTSYDLKSIWRFVDWTSEDYNPYIKEKYVVDNIDQLANFDPLINNYARVKNTTNIDGINRYSVYRYNGVEWILIYKEKSTIQFTDSIWNAEANTWGWDNFLWDTNSWDQHTGYFISYIFDILRDSIFVGAKKEIYNDIWFTMLDYIHSENDMVDWALKSTYIKLFVEKDLKKSKKFETDKTDLLLDYINKNKPFRTKLRDFTDINKTIDEFSISVEELGNVVDINNVYNRYSGYTWNGDTLLKGGDDWEDQEFIDKLDITDVEDYIYDGNDFYYPQYKGYDQELLSMSMQDAVVITVTRNESGSIEDTNTKRLILFKNNREKLETSLITDEYITELTQNITKDSDIITLNDIHPNGLTSGSIWINHEKISYQNNDENILYNCTRGVGKTFAKENTSGSVVYYDNKIQPIFDIVNINDTQKIILKI